jgi:hypothetical protein
MPFKNIERRRQYHREYMRCWKPEQRKRLSRKSYEKHRNDVKAKSLIWRVKHPDAVKESNKKSRARNRNQYRAAQRRWWLASQGNPQTIMARRLRGRVKAACQRARTAKANKTILLLGCTFAEFVRHIERQFTKGMGWHNRRLWQIDHVRPCASFDLTDPVQQYQCFHFTNQRPIWKQDNQLKGAQRTFLI